VQGVKCVLFAYLHWQSALSHHDNYCIATQVVNVVILLVSVCGCLLEQGFDRDHPKSVIGNENKSSWWYIFDKGTGHSH